MDGLPNALLRYAPDVITGVNSAERHPHRAARAGHPDDRPESRPADRQGARVQLHHRARGHQGHRRARRLDRHRGPQPGDDGAVQSQPGQQLCLVRNHRPCRCPPAPSPTPRAGPTTRPSIGDIRVYSKFGYSNFTGIQLEAERRFSKGMAFQFFYLLSNSMSTGATPSQGGDFTQNAIDQPDRFLPGAYPSSVERSCALLSLFTRRRHPQAPHPLQLPVRPAVGPGQEVLRQRRQQG